MTTEYIVVMDDQEVRIENIDEEEIPAVLDSGFVSAVLKVVGGKIVYADIDWGEYRLKEWKKPELVET